MLLPIFLIVLVDIFAFTLVIPLLAIYAEHLGATPFEATMLVSVFALCQLVSGPLLLSSQEVMRSSPPPRRRYGAADETGRRGQGSP